MRLFLIVSCVVVALLIFPSPAPAAGDPEITIMPLGTVTAEQGVHDVSYRLPVGSQGPLPQALVLVAAQPWFQEIPAVGEPNPEDRVQVPAVLRLTAAGRQLPEWQLEKYATAYVVNLQTLQKNAEYQTGRFAASLGLDTTAATLDMFILGMPDPLLLDDSRDGPLTTFAEAAADVDIKAYLNALVLEIGGQKEAARGEYDKLRAAKNEQVARFARRGLRMLSYNLRKRRLSGNLMEHYRWALYLQQCGFVAAAYLEFDECRVIRGMHSGSQFRAGEMLDHQGGDLITVLRYLQRTAEVEQKPDALDFYVLLAVLKSRGDKTLTAQETDKIKSDWLYALKTILAASRGSVRIWPSYFEIASEQKLPYITYGDGVVGPSDDLIERRGWFDGVISVRPRLPGDSASSAVTVGGDQGPKGAALSALYNDCLWSDYVKAWNQQMAWAIRVGEIGPNPPIVDNALACGNQPIPNAGYGLRAALRYHVSPAVIRRTNIVDGLVPGSAVQLWRVEGPYTVSERPPAEGLPARHVMDPIPAGPAPKTIELVAEGDFVDLAALFPNAGWARARATSWVFSPDDRQVRMWLGQNDGMAVWLNGRCIHQGRYYSAGKYEDKNLVDTIASFADLKRGWNELRVVVEAWPTPRDNGWGFSVRFCDNDNKPIPEIACVNNRPESGLVPPSAPAKAGAYHSWNVVKNDLYESLPCLTAVDLQAITGVKELSIGGAIAGNVGYVIVAVPGRPASTTYRPLSEPWQPAKDRDWVLNNLMDWSREDVAALRYAKDGKARDLLILRPEAFEAYLLLLNEPAAAEAVFGKVKPADRILGYVLVPAGAEEFSLLVVDTLLAEGDKWPIDEDDLMTPISSEFIPNMPQASPGQVGPQP